MQPKPIKVLIAKPGLDGHESGARVIARGLVDAGMEVIYTGPRQRPQMIVNTAIQENVDIVGLSILSGAHKELCGRVIELFRQNDLGNIPVILGGIIPDGDIGELKKMGVREIFGPGTSTTEVAHYIQELLGREKNGRVKGNNH